MRTTDRLESVLVHTAFGIMVVLGIATVMSGVALWIAAAHQLVGALTVVATVRAMHAYGLARSAR